MAEDDEENKVGIKKPIVKKSILSEILSKAPTAEPAHTSDSSVKDEVKEKAIVSEEVLEKKKPSAVEERLAAMDRKIEEERQMAILSAQYEKRVAELKSLLESEYRKKEEAMAKKMEELGMKIETMAKKEATITPIEPFPKDKIEMEMKKMEETIRTKLELEISKKAEALKKELGEETRGREILFKREYDTTSMKREKELEAQINVRIKEEVEKIKKEMENERQRKEEELIRNLERDFEKKLESFKKELEIEYKKNDEYLKKDIELVVLKKEKEIREALEEQIKKKMKSETKETFTKPKTFVYPFSAIVGRELMKRSLILNVIDPNIGGVLLYGPKGNAKTTAIRAVGNIIPEGMIWCATGCEKFKEEGRSACYYCDKRYNVGVITTELFTADYTIDTLLKNAEISIRGEYKEEWGRQLIEILKKGIKDEKDRKAVQQLDEIQLKIEIKKISDIEEEIEILRRRSEFDSNPQKFIDKFITDEEKILESITKAKTRLGRIVTHTSLLKHMIELCSKIGFVTGHDSELLIERIARARAAYEGKEAITIDDLTEALSTITIGAKKELVAPEKLRAMEEKEEEEIKMLSDVEFYQGFVRLKVAVKNSSNTAVLYSLLRIVYNEEALRLDRIEPQYPMKGDEVNLGNIEANEKKTVAYYFDPQICLGSYVDGTLTYKDVSGKLKHADMKRKLVSVVCPIIYTDENINTAMLKRMIKDELDETDIKVFKIPEKIQTPLAFLMAKRAIQHHDVRLVREFIEKAPYTAEVWYYGKIRGRDDKLIIRAIASDTSRTVEFFVASNSVLVVTGLLAELKTSINYELKSELAKGRIEGLPGPRLEITKLEQIFDAKTIETIKARPLLIEKYADEEIKAGDTVIK